MRNDSFSSECRSFNVVPFVCVWVVVVVVVSGIRPRPCQVSWRHLATANLLSDQSDVPDANRWVSSSYPKRSSIARFAFLLASRTTELAFRFAPLLAPRMAPLLTPPIPAKTLGSPNGPPLFNCFQPSFLASDRAEVFTSLKMLPRNDPRLPPP